MAKVQVQMPDEFLGKISKLGKHTDEITERALQAGSIPFQPTSRNSPMTTATSAISAWVVSVTN
nr:hypothetical protein [uncultured Ruminococcus sp.]